MNEELYSEQKIQHRHSNYLIRLVHEKLEIDQDLEMTASIRLVFYTKDDAGEFDRPVLDVIREDTSLTESQKGMIWKCSGPEFGKVPPVVPWCFLIQASWYTRTKTATIPREPSPSCSIGKVCRQQLSRGNPGRKGLQCPLGKHAGNL